MHHTRGRHSGASRRDQADGEPRTSRRTEAAFVAHTGSVHMMQPHNVMNVSDGRAPNVNLIFNAESPSALSSPSHRDSEAIFEPDVEARADHEIYYHQLLTKKRGSPLWVPGPGMQLPIEYRRQGISIGDVGIITSSGQFDFLFNIFLPANHPINVGSVPPTFSPLSHGQLERDIQETLVYGQNSYLSSSSVRKAERSWTSWLNDTFATDQTMTFESTSREAAILTMPDGALTQDLLNELQIHQYISENILNWYNYARNERGRNIKIGDIRIVIGVDKVKSWGIATSTCNSGQTAFLTFKPNNQSGSYRWDCTGGSGRVGPDEIEIRDLIQNGITPQNQCVFVRTMNFTFSGEIEDDSLRSMGLPFIVSGRYNRRDSVSTNRGSSRGGRTSGGRGASSSHQNSSTQSRSIIFQPTTMQGVVYHPSTALHAYLHKRFPDASLVITQDSDWISVLDDDDTLFPKPDVLLERILKRFKPSERDGVVTIRGRSDLDVPIDPRHLGAIRDRDHSKGRRTQNQMQSTNESRPRAQVKATPLPTPLPPLRKAGVELVVLRGHQRSINSVAFSPDGSKLASASNDKTVRVWDAGTGLELAVLGGHTDWIQSVGFSPDGSKIASASDDKTVRLWDARTNAELAVLSGHTDWINSVVFSPDGSKIASASRDKTVRLWDARTNAVLAVLRGHLNWINSVAFSPDSSKIASGSGDETVRVWDSRTCEQIGSLEGHSGSIHSVAFSPDWSKIASGSRDKTVRLWDAQTKAELAVLCGHLDWINSVVFSPDSSKIASGSGDETVRLWDSQTYAEIGGLEGHSGSIHSLAFSPDGTKIASVSGDLTVRLWDVQTASV